MNNSLGNDNNKMKLMMSNVELINSNSLRSENIMNTKTKNNKYLLNHSNRNDKNDDEILTLTNRVNFFKDWEYDRLKTISEDKQLTMEQKNDKDPSEFMDLLNTKSSIIIIDDHQLLRENTINLIKSVLTSLNMCSDYNIIEGSDGIELLNIIRLDKDNKIKCIFIDENMEYLNGSETVNIIRKLEQVHKINKYFIISLTALDDDYYTNKIMNSGVDMVIPKPCTKSDLKNIFTKLK